MNNRLIRATAALALAGSACAQGSPPTDPSRMALGERAGSSDDQPAPAAAETPVYIEGPNGELLIESPGPPADGKLSFKQIAGHVWKGQVLGSDLSFAISRLPATFVTTVGNEVCTATLIGPQVLLTAAHCVDAGKRNGEGWLTLAGSVTLADGSPGQDIHSCAMAPAYTASRVKPKRVRNENDYALCELFLPLNVRAEPIALEPNRSASGQSLLIAGYGCTEEDLIGGVIVADNPTGGTLHVGMNRVRAGGPDGWISLKGRIGSTEAILCPGDSGGAAYAGASLTPTNADRGWKVVAVNSAVGPAGGSVKGEYLSYLAPLSDPDFKTFLDGWVARRPAERQICGLEGVQLGSKCRQ